LGCAAARAWVSAHAGLVKPWGVGCEQH
jgi:hypothetical protein